MNTKLESQIIEISSIIDGLDIALNRTQELNERLILNHSPFDSSEEMTFALDTLKAILRNDREELKSTMKALQTKLE